MKLITPFACDRNLEGVMSGIKATTGVLQSAILINNVLVHKTNNGRIDTIGINPKAIAAIGAPIKMNGIRLPILVLNRSEKAPTDG
jgi:hypothetical protein